MLKTILLSTVALLGLAAATTQSFAQEMPKELRIGILGGENEADRLYRRLLAKLFDGGFDALTVLKLKEVAEQLEAAADAFENVANAVETIVVKES